MKTKFKRFLCMLLAVMMIASTPMTVFAENRSGLIDGSLSLEDDSPIDAVVKNTATDKFYQDLQSALKEVAAGETLTLLKDAESTIVTVPVDATLDLNGYMLTAAYVTSFGDIIDGSEEDAGVLKVADKQFMIQNDNAQLPVKCAEGYKFFTVEKISAKYTEEASKFSFKPYIEEGAHELLKAGAEQSGVSIKVHISWKSENGNRTQDFQYTDSLVKSFLNGYDANTGKYDYALTLVVKNAEKYEDMTFSAVVVSNKGVSKTSETYGPTTDVVPTEKPGKLEDDVILDTEKASAVVAEGTKVDGKSLALTTEEMSETTTDVKLSDGEEMLSLNVHVDGVAKDNTVPVLVTINEIAPEYLNKGNITLYHVENGVTVEMTRVYSLEEVDEHNEFYYDILTGTITMALASFSEIAVVADNVNAWNGEYDYSWYTNGVATVDGEATADYIIANADQLAAFGAIVGGMNGQTQDSFAGKTVKLIADINIGDDENANANLIFHPIGYYYTDDKNADGTTGDYYSTVKSFEGTFDGNGHKISNFYQNTWEIKGDYDGNYYSDAMGLFGYVVNGTVKNLTVDNFSSDGEFTPTGVIAAYAVNSTFKNIAITNCNPRVYNTGNGGIVGIGGNSDDPDTYKLTFENITIDNTNKITALWGSWDVACGGLVGMFRGAGHVYMTNCHVAAQMDVYNDVCGNYQYYWYRYSGMMVGTNKNMTTDKDGYTVPETSKFHAKGCTVHFGDWNDYYYCELVANSLASYTHDHQFSRLEEVKELKGKTITYLDGTTGEVPNAGRCNYVVVNGEEATKNVTCYHFVDGKVHNHNDYNGDGVDDYETVNDESILVENNQHIYLPFNQLFTGYGWGVKHIPVYNGEDYAFEGITILDREVADSVVKFEKVDTAKDSYTTESKVTVGDLFKAAEIADEKLTIKTDKVQVTVSPVGEESTAGGTYTANTTDWTQGTLTFSGIGAATITITDYYFCTPTTITVTIKDHNPIVKFNEKVADGTIYEIEDEINIGDLFEAATIDTSKFEIKSDQIEVTFVEGEGSSVSGTYTANDVDWTQGTITFNGIGTLTITITDNYYCIPTTITITVKDHDPIVKFTEVADEVSYEEETEVFVGDLFEAATIDTSKFEIKSDQVQVTVETVGEESTASGTYTANTVDWTKGTLTFNGVGALTITITDNYYCIPTTILVNITKRENVVKFATKFDGDFLYRVGNAKNSPVALGTLFEGISDDIGTVSVTIKALEGTGASGKYTANTTDWTKGTIQFSGTGLVKVTITDNDYCTPTELILEVVDAVNATSKTEATANNVVLLQDVIGGFTVSNGYAVYGNGFKVICSGDGSYRSAAVSYGFITVENGGILDNAQVICDIFPESYLFTNEMKQNSSGKYPYGYSAVVITGNSTISNCYIYGARNNILINEGNVTIKNTVTECGSLANIHINSLDAYTVTLENLTTIQYGTNSKYDTTKSVLGFGILVGMPESSSNANIKLLGDLKQYNWVSQSDASSVSNRYAATAITNALKEESYIHNIDGKDSINMGIAFLNKKSAVCIDERHNKGKIIYELNDVTIAGYTGQVYSITESTEISLQNRYNPETDGVLPYNSIMNCQIKPMVTFENATDAVVFTSQYSEIAKEQENKLQVDLDNITGGSYSFSFDSIKLKKYGKELAYTVLDQDGNTVDKNQTIILNELKNLSYRLVCEDTLCYDKEGELIKDKKERVSLLFTINATKTSIEPPKFTNAGTATAIRLVETKGGDWRPAYTALTGVTVTYWSASESKVKTVDLSTLYNSGTISSNVWTYTCDDYTLTITGGAVHSDGTTITPVVSNNTLYFASTNKAFGTGTTSRNIVLTYVFTDKNASTTWNRTETVTYSNLKEYDYNSFKDNELKEPSSGGSIPCVTPDTLVTLADGTQKRIAQTNYEDQFLVWDFVKGEYASAPASIIKNHGYGEYEVVRVQFADGTVVNATNGHGFYHKDTNEFVILSASNVDEYIGHEFIKEDMTSVELVDYSVETQYTESWSILTAEHYNCILEGMLTITPAEVEGSPNYLMPFKVNDDMKYDEEARLKDIEIYGLYTYEEFEDLITYDQFMALNLPTFKVAVGKGYITYDEIVYLLNLHMQ